MIQKLLNCFVVRRGGLENKWWHRLSNVLILGSTGILFVDLLYLFLSLLGWFILWESIVYRTLIYIIYGRQK